jgi:hypothetical protein
MKNAGGTEEQVITPQVKQCIDIDEKTQTELLNQVGEQEW